MTELMDGAGSLEEGQPGGVASDRVEIRLLGSLKVRRAAGELVSPRDWRTGKTADLLRLLALSNPDIVPVSTLLDALWPKVDEQRARASLRTAACHLRKVIGSDSVVRHSDGFRLAGAWVDAGAFSQLAREVAGHRRKGRLAECVQVAREAEALYVEDFRAHDDDAVWASDWRAQLAHEYLAMLTEAAEAAVELGWMRDAVDFSAQVLEQDQCSERACRAQMLGYAGLGETDRALRTFERCRQVLAEELGADPSPQTASVHLQVLRADPVELDSAPWVGRHAEVQWLGQVLESVVTSGRSTVVLLTGAHGSGRHRLVQQATQRSGLRELSPAEGTSAADLLRQVGDGDAVVVVLPRSEVTGPDGRPELARELMAAPASVVLVLVGDPQDDQDAGHRLPGDLAADVRHLEVQRLTPAEIGVLAARVLKGAVAPQLIAELTAASDGNPSAALTALTEWARAGRITATATGLVLAATGVVSAGVRGVDDARPHAVDAMLARVVDQLRADEIEILALAAMLEFPLSAAGLAELLDLPGTPLDRRAAAQSAVEHLADLGVVTTGERGVALRDPVLSAAVESWLRPAVRRRLHVRIAEQARISASERMRHWESAGETELACAAALDAARVSASEGRWSDTHDRLQQVWRLADPAASPQDLFELHELLGDACRALGRREEAGESYVAAATLARVHDMDELARVSVKRDEMLAAPRAPAEPAPARAGVAHHDGTDWTAVLDEVETHLLPRRDFANARHASMQAAARAAAPDVRARAALLTYVPDLLLGDPTGAEEPLQMAVEQARLAGAHSAAWALDRAVQLIAHDRGAPSRHPELSTPETADADEWSWTTVRILADCGDVTGAAQLVPQLPLPEGRPLIRHLGLLASAETRLACGEGHAAEMILKSLLDEMIRDSHPLLVPHVVARLVCLLAPHDAVAAHDFFDLFDQAVGSSGDLPREQAWRQLARAAIRAAAGRPRAAAGSAAIAAKVAIDIGVLPLAARAEARRATYLRAAGELVESRLAAAEAARLRVKGNLAVVEHAVAAPDRPAAFGRARLKIS